jgi:hypothetical protein
MSVLLNLTAKKKSQNPELYVWHNLIYHIANYAKFSSGCYLIFMQVLKDFEYIYGTYLLI